jgi:hypothetical protein
VPFTLRNIKGDIEDIGRVFDGPADLEFRAVTKPLVGGSGRMKLDDEIVDLKQWDAVRVPPGTWRGYEAGPDGLEILVTGAPNLGENPRDDVDGQRGWWG